MPATEYGDLADGKARRRFSREFDKNFTVTAPAGVGKTRAIVDRVINITLADGDTSVSILPQLLVVTYTRKAAEEMKERARGKLLRCSLHPDKIERFDQIFFGTIHSLCLDIVQTHGHALGIPASVETIEREEPLWLEFIRSLDNLSAALPQEACAHFRRHTDLKRIVELARNLSPQDEEISALCPYPEIDLTAALGFVPKQSTKVNVKAGQQRLRRWSKELTDDVPYLPIPNIRTGGQEFLALVREAFLPLQKWLSVAAQVQVRALAAEYRRYRIERGLLTYDDMVSCAAQLLRLPGPGEALRSRGYRVILDEAQDTDATQFEVLIGLTQSPDDWCAGKKSKATPPGPGRFSMVGDPQQSIYGSRVNLATYLDVARRLQKSGSAELLKFSVTFRCDVEIVKAVNRLFPHVLNGHDGQVLFEPLRPRPNAGRGGVIRYKLTPPVGFQRGSGVEETGEAEALALGRWLADCGLQGLGVPNWQDIAILCPRKRWLPRIHYALREVGLASVIQSRGDTFGDNPAHAWLTGLLVCFAEPENGFEVVGVLRDIFGISDHELAVYADGYRAGDNGDNPFQISAVVPRDGIVGDTLNHLAGLCAKCAQLALRNAVDSLVDETLLLQRLEALPGYPPGYLARSLATSLIEIANFEEEGVRLWELAAKLRVRFDQILDDDEAQANEIRLITCHKAKGLEWDVVILPYLFREIGFPQERFPRVLQTTDGPCLALWREQQPEAVRERKERLRHQEYERLLYVAATRARKLLILVDSEGFYSQANTRSKFTSSQLLRVQPGGENRIRWTEFDDSYRPLRRDLEAIEPARLDDISFRPLDGSHFQTAREVGGRFLNHRTPSTLDRSEEFIRTEIETNLMISASLPEIETTHSLEAVTYGIWWHQMMETNPWANGRDAWHQNFGVHLEGCPDPLRGRYEVTLFQESKLWRDLQDPDLIIRTEVPFLWRSGEFEVIDGFIDLVVWNPKEECWLIVDWKTGHLPEGPTEILKDQYLSQIRAYRDAVQAIRREVVESGLFSTSTGTFLVI